MWPRTQPGAFQFFVVRSRVVERMKELGAKTEILRQLSSPLVTLYPLHALERECEGKVSRELVEEWTQTAKKSSSLRFKNSQLDCCSYRELFWGQGCVTDGQL